MNDPNPSRPPGPGTACRRANGAPGDLALSQLPHFERLPPTGTPATMRFRWPEHLLRGDVIEGLRDPWAVVAHVTRSGPDVTIRVQEAGGSRTMASAPGSRASACAVTSASTRPPSRTSQTGSLPGGECGVREWSPRGLSRGTPSPVRRQSTPARPAGTAANTSSSWKRPTAPGPRSTPTGRAAGALGGRSWQRD